jgi:hypothetical protein
MREEQKAQPAPIQQFTQPFAAPFKGSGRKLHARK